MTTTRTRKILDGLTGRRPTRLSRLALLERADARRAELDDRAIALAERDPGSLVLIDLLREAQQLSEAIERAEVRS